MTQETPLLQMAEIFIAMLVLYGGIIGSGFLVYWAIQHHRRKRCRTSASRESESEFPPAHTNARRDFPIARTRTRSRN